MEFENNELERNLTQWAIILLCFISTYDHHVPTLEKFNDIEPGFADVIFDIINEKVDETISNSNNEFNNPISRFNDNNHSLVLKYDTLENEYLKLQHLNEELKQKNENLTTNLFNTELNLKEAEAKYIDLVKSVENEKQNSKDSIDPISLSIQLSELAGKLEAKDLIIAKYKDEKEKLIYDFNEKIKNIGKEADLHKEKSLKYDVLSERMKNISLEEVNILKQKLLQYEKIIKEQNDKLTKFKNSDDKAVILKKIEELNFQLVQEKEKNIEMVKENDHLKDLIIQHENEIKFLKKRLDQHKKDEIIQEVDSADVYTTLHDIQDDLEAKKSIIDLETKLKVMIESKETLQNDKQLLEEKIKTLMLDIENYKQYMETDKEKYEKFQSAIDYYKNEIEKVSSHFENEKRFFNSTIHSLGLLIYSNMSEGKEFSWEVNDLLLN